MYKDEFVSFLKAHLYSQQSLLRHFTHSTPGVDIDETEFHLALFALVTSCEQQSTLTQTILKLLSDATLNSSQLPKLINEFYINYAEQQAQFPILTRLVGEIIFTLDNCPFSQEEVLTCLMQTNPARRFSSVEEIEEFVNTDEGPMENLLLYVTEFPEITNPAELQDILDESSFDLPTSPSDLSIDYSRRNSETNSNTTESGIDHPTTNLENTQYTLRRHRFFANTLSKIPTPPHVKETAESTTIKFSSK